MSEHEEVTNLDYMSYEEWLDFIFDHPVIAYESILQNAPVEPWYFEDEWEYTISSTVAIDRLTRLFRSPGDLVSRYSSEQIDQGFWFIPGPFGMMWSILDESVAWDSRKACIRSIPDLASKLLCKLQSGTACVMWWDSTFSYCAFGEKNLGSDLAVLTEIARSIVTIAHQDDPSAKQMARHGIKHLERLSKATASEAIRSIYAWTIAEANLR